MATQADVRTRVTQLLPRATEKALREVVPLLVTGFPATPKMYSPEPAGQIWIYDDGTNQWGVVGCLTNRPDLSYVLTVLDLTDPNNVVPDQPIPTPGYSFIVLIPINYLIFGHQYRIRIEVDPGMAGPDDEYDTVYIEFW